MSEIRREPEKMIRILHGEYIDFFGRPSTEAAYLAQGLEGMPGSGPYHEQSVYVDGGEVGEAPTVAVVAARLIAGSGIPHENELLDDGFVYGLSLPATQSELTQTKGIGKKGAQKIAAWVEDNWGLEIA